MKERVALYLQDAHDLRDGLEYVHTPKKEVLRLSGKPKAAWFAMRSYRWQLTQQSLRKSKYARASSTTETRNIGLLASTFLTLDDLAPNRIICGTVPGGIRWRKMLVSPAAILWKP
jgi:5,10-methylenetetrahydromethanopterin reductase